MPTFPPQSNPQFNPPLPAPPLRPSLPTLEPNVQPSGPPANQEQKIPVKLRTISNPPSLLQDPIKLIFNKLIFYPLGLLDDLIRSILSKINFNIFFFIIVIVIVIFILYPDLHIISCFVDFFKEKY
jgi:hypothetical protein